MQLPQDGVVESQMGIIIVIKKGGYKENEYGYDNLAIFIGYC